MTVTGSNQLDSSVLVALQLLMILLKFLKLCMSLFQHVSHIHLHQLVSYSSLDVVVSTLTYRELNDCKPLQTSVLRVPTLQVRPEGD